MTSLSKAPARRTPAPRALHAVQFYESSDFLIESASRFAQRALDAGDGFLLVAHPSHRSGIESRLASAGLDPAGLTSRGRYRALDAADTIDRLTVGGRPDRQRFRRVVGGALTALAGGKSRRVSAFGEMVALLYEADRQAEALELERLWNEIGLDHPLSLLCAYPIASFRSREDGARFADICSEHSRVVPAESYAELAPDVERDRAIASLQQKAARLEAEASRRESLEEELRRKVEELAEADRRKDEFLAMLGHELRNPLSPIVTALELMRVRADDPDLIARSIDVISRQTRRMTRLVDDLLDVSRITRGKIDLKRETVSLVSLVERAVEQVRPLVDERGHRLTLKLPDETVTLFADATRIEQVLANLLINAAKYTEIGGKIDLSAGRVGREIEIAVRDNGVGLDRQMKERIFDLFVQAPGFSRGTRAGLGVGLTLVRRLVELHGGRVEASSKGLGRGSEFKVRLPLPRREASDRWNEGGRSSAAPRTADMDRKTGGAGRRILVVDDNVEAAEGLAELLRAFGHDVRVRHGGAEAIEEALSSFPEVVFLDIGMADVDGHEVARRLRGEPALRSCVLIALTGFGQEGDKSVSREAGFDHHVVKPVDFATIETLLQPPS